MVDAQKMTQRYLVRRVEISWRMKVDGQVRVIDENIHLERRGGH